MLRSLADGLWDTSRNIRVQRILTMPRRMTVVRSWDGLTIHSPVAWEDKLAAAVRTLGPVRRIVAPCLPHDRWLAPWLEAFREARFLAVEGFEPAGDPLPREPEPLERSNMPDDLVLFPIAGMPRHRETVLYHQQSLALIVADLVFNIQEAADPLSWLIHRLNGCWKRTTPSRYFKSLIENSAAFRRSLEPVLELEIDLLVPGHGEVVERDARRVLGRALANGPVSEESSRG